MSTLSSLASGHRTHEVVQLIDLPVAARAPEHAAPLGPAHSPLLDVKTHMQVCVGGASVTVGELTQMKLGHVLRLDREVDGLVDLLVEGRVIARGQLVAAGDHFGVRITEVPAPLLP